MDFPPGNSNESKERRRERPEPEEPRKPEVRKVVTGGVIRRKKSPMSRFRKMFIDDDGRNLIEQMIEDVVIPAFKDMVWDTFTGGLSRSMYGEGGPSARRFGHNRPSSGPTNYNRFSGPNRDRREESRDSYRRLRSDYEIDDIILKTRFEAEELSGQLYDLMEQYGEVSVADLYQMVDITPSVIDERRGWISGKFRARVVRVGGGYLVDLPPAESLR